MIDDGGFIGKFMTVITIVVLLTASQSHQSIITKSGFQKATHLLVAGTRTQGRNDTLTGCPTNKFINPEACKYGAESPPSHHDEPQSPADDSGLSAKTEHRPTYSPTRRDSVSVYARSMELCEVPSPALMKLTGSLGPRT